jgi:hypothetical protein
MLGINGHLNITSGSLIHQAKCPFDEGILGKPSGVQRTGGN